MYTSRKKLKLQGKTKSHRKALIKSQIVELVRNGRIKTTPKKAKALKATFDRVVTNYKKNTGGNYRNVKKALMNDERALERLGHVVENFLNDRNSGYTRVIKTLNRAGDNAEQVYVMLVNTEVREKQSKMAKLLEKREENKEKTVKGKINKAVKKATKSDNKKKESKK